MSNSIPLDPASERYVSLATFRRNGAEVKTPVWVAADAGRCYVFSAGDAGKVKRIRVTPHVRLAACDFHGNVRGAWVDGEARIVSAPADIARARRALRAKYGVQMYVTDFFATLFRRMRKRAYIEIALRGQPAR
jgi:uncharacterized protein